MRFSSDSIGLDDRSRPNNKKLAANIPITIEETQKIFKALNINKINVKGNHIHIVITCPYAIKVCFGLNHLISFIDSPFENKFLSFSLKNDMFFSLNKYL
jgi:hypothetical protein